MKPTKKPLSGLNSLQKVPRYRPFIGRVRVLPGDQMLTFDQVFNDLFNHILAPLLAPVDQYSTGFTVTVIEQRLDLGADRVSRVTMFAQLVGVGQGAFIADVALDELVGPPDMLCSSQT